MATSTGTPGPDKRVDGDNGWVDSPLDSANENTIELRTVGYLCSWLFIVGLHGACALYLTQLARVFAFLTQQIMKYWAELAAGGWYTLFGHASTVCYLLAALHWWQLLYIVLCSLLARKVVLPNSTFSISILSAHIKALSLPARMLLRVFTLLFDRRGVFGIESRTFHAVFLAREVVEIASQTFQARRSSELLPRPWLNNLYVALIIVNCWSTPVLQFLLRRHQALERVVCSLLDVLLNIGSSILIPIAVFLPYYEALSPVSLTFPTTLTYDGLWFSRLVMENKLLFSLSTADIFSKIIPHLGIYSSLVSAASLIYPAGFRKVAPADATHCPELRVPSSVQDFPNLLGLQFHNNTLLEWPKESAISVSKHLNLAILIIARTNMTGFPDGMLDPLPVTLTNIQLSRTNLTALPDDLHHRWHSLSTFLLEYSLLSEFPKTLCSFFAARLSLQGNRIEVVPENAFVKRGMFYFVISSNPLRTLPDSLGPGASFRFFSAENTAVASLPEWITASVSDTSFLFGTPFCKAQASSPSKVACTTRDRQASGKLPLAIVDSHFPL